MSEWIQEFDGIFWMSLATILVGAFGVSVKYCLKSKCEHLTLCCGLLTIDRRVDLEVQSELRQMEMGIEDKDDFAEGLRRTSLAMPESKMAMPESKMAMPESKMAMPLKQQPAQYVPDNDRLRHGQVPLPAKK